MCRFVECRREKDTIVQHKLVSELVQHKLEQLELLVEVGKVAVGDRLVVADNCDHIAEGRMDAEVDIGDKLEDTQAPHHIEENGLLADIAHTK
jgi:hypothetical protein